MKVTRRTLLAVAGAAVLLDAGAESARDLDRERASVSGREGFGQSLRLKLLAALRAKACRLPSMNTRRTKQSPGPPTEIAGPCFSPDGRTLFLNFQVEGLTLAIRGPIDEEVARGGALKQPANRAANADANTAGLARIARTAYRRRRVG